MNDVGFNNLAEMTIREIMNIIHMFFGTGLPELIYPKNNNDHTIRDSLELSTISKIFVHPLLNQFGGIQNLQRVEYKKLEINYLNAKRVRNLFIKLFIKGFIEKENKWPLVSFTKRTHPILVKSWQQNRYPTELEMTSLPELSWSHINLNKNFLFDYSIDTSELLFDKACAPPASFWTQKYDPCGFKIHYNQNKPKLPRQETRVIFRYLKGTPNEVQEVANEINTGNPEPENDITFQTRKER